MNLRTPLLLLLQDNDDSENHSYVAPSNLKDSYPHLLSNGDDDDADATNNNKKKDPKAEIHGPRLLMPHPLALLSFSIVNGRTTRGSDCYSNGMIFTSPPLPLPHVFVRIQSISFRIGFIIGILLQLATLGFNLLVALIVHECRNNNTSNNDNKNDMDDRMFNKDSSSHRYNNNNNMNDMNNDSSSWWCTWSSPPMVLIFLWTLVWSFGSALGAVLILRGLRDLLVLTMTTTNMTIPHHHHHRRGKQSYYDEQKDDDDDATDIDHPPEGDLEEEIMDPSRSVTADNNIGGATTATSLAWWQQQDRSHRHHHSNNNNNNLMAEIQIQDLLVMHLVCQFVLGVLTGICLGWCVSDVVMHLPVPTLESVLVWIVSYIACRIAVPWLFPGVVTVPIDHVVALFPHEDDNNCNGRAMTTTTPSSSIITTEMVDVDYRSSNASQHPDVLLVLD